MAKKKKAPSNTKKAPAKKKSSARKKNAPRNAKKVGDFAKAKRAVGKYGSALEMLPGVTGLSIGPRFRNGKPTREMTIRLHVDTISAKAKLCEIADKLKMKKEYGGVGVDIVVWDFRTAAGPFLDGTKICRKIPGTQTFETGTLGTSAIRFINSRPKAVWLTAAHVVWPSAPATDVDIHLWDTKEVIGTVSKDDYFLDPHVDAAYIVPNDTAKISVPKGRSKRALRPTDANAQVTMSGAETKNSTGDIVSLFARGQIKNTVSGAIDPFEDHFLVWNKDKDFAVQGDSGAIVCLDSGELVGVLRGVIDKKVPGEKAVAVVAKLDTLVTHTRNLGRELSL
jgi:hypothetical protein